MKKKKTLQSRKTTSTSKAKKAGSKKRRRRVDQAPKVLESPTFQGKPKKLPRDSYPESSCPDDFDCFGPAATKDGELDGVRICDLGCFEQDGKDSNKYYHGAVVQHHQSENWYTYFEWGRTGGSSCSFQFVACQSEEDARKVFAKQIHAKNDKRGEWVTIAGIRTLRAKSGKDCYLVRPMVSRTTGLPGAKHIKSGAQKATAVRKKEDCPPQGDPITLKLLRDLRKATIAYTRQNMADSSIPTQVAIDEARAILGEARTHIGTLDDDIETQREDKKLMQLTRLMFSRIPRKKRVGAAAATWLLSQNNIQDWDDDLDAFESALRSLEMNPDADILAEMDLEMEWLCPDSRVGAMLHDWWPRSTANRHEKIDSITIRNLWTVNRRSSANAVPKAQKRVLRGKIDLSEKPKLQPRTRFDLPTAQRKIHKQSNTALLMHGTRSVNVTGILREALRMPDTLVAVALTGAKFGPGIYFSDDWKKAANYSNAKGSQEAGRRGAVRGRKAFMFAADVVLGTPHVPDQIQGFTKPPRGHHSVFGKAGYSGVDDNEYVIYQSDQCQLKYLIEFETT